MNECKLAQVVSKRAGYDREVRRLWRRLWRDGSEGAALAGHAKDTKLSQHCQGAAADHPIPAAWRAEPGRD